MRKTKAVAERKFDACRHNIISSTGIPGSFRDDDKRIQHLRVCVVPGNHPGDRRTVVGPLFLRPLPLHRRPRIPHILLAPAAEATTAQAKARAYRIAQSLKKQGMSFRDDYWHGLLRRKGSITIKTKLKANTQYVLVGGGCSDAFDVDIIVYDENGNEVGRNTKVDAVPVVLIKPKWSGTFHIKVKLASSTRDGAHYALIVGYNSR